MKDFFNKLKRINRTILVCVVVLAGVFSIFIFGKLKNEYQEKIISGPLDSFTEASVSPSPTTYQSWLADDHEMEDAYRPVRFRSAEAMNIKKVIPHNAFLRDFAPLQGENAFLALYVLNPDLSSKESVMDYSDQTGGFPMWCGADDFGQTISGTYKLALVRDGHIINEVSIPFPDYNKWPDHLFKEKDPETGAIGYSETNDINGVWKNEGGLMFRHARCILDGSYYGEENSKCMGSGIDFLETRQLQLMDLTGDGLPHEVRFMTEYISCGNDYYVIAGYNKETDRVMIYNIIDKDGSHPSYDDFDPRADGTVIYDSGCDHGSTRHEIAKFRFDNKQRGYVQYSSTGTIGCGDPTWYP